MAAAQPGPELVVWATAGWAAALGPSRCEGGALAGTELALQLASTMKRSIAGGGIGVASAGALGDHPLLAYFARADPELLAQLLADAGVNALVLGVADIAGPLLREPALAVALRERGVALVASNLDCRGEAWCAALSTADDPLPIVERAGLRYALIGLLPEDLLGRVEPAGERRVRLRAAADTLIRRTLEARAAGADLVVASIDHGSDATAAAELANFLERLPPRIRPDLMLSPSSGEKLLFMRPLDVHPAVIGTQRGVLTAAHVTRLVEVQDLDVMARRVPLEEVDPALALAFARLGREFCAGYGVPLPSGALVAPLDGAGLLALGAGAVREWARADIAVVDPVAFERDFAAPAGARLQRAELQRAVLLDAPLVTASVPLAWLTELDGRLGGLRPLARIGMASVDGAAVIAGRAPVPEARYRVVTSAVLARSGRLPGGVDWSPLASGVDRPATLRSALLWYFEQAEAADPRARLRDPAQGTEWVYRASGDVTLDLTATQNRANYDQPALQADEILQLGLSTQLRLDADSPEYLFENVAQAAFDRNYDTGAINQDLAFLESTYTYRGWWPGGFWVPVPFVEGYLETEFERGDAPYHHLLLRPELGFRSLLNQYLSLKLSGGLQYEALDPNGEVRPGLGAEVVLKPWSVAFGGGNFQLEGNLFYYWSAPGTRDEHLLQGQLIAGIPVFGPLQFTFSALGAMRKDRGEPFGQGLGLKAGIRLRYVDRSLVE